MNDLVSSVPQDPILQCQQLGMTYSDGTLDVEVLKDINIEIKAGQRIAIVGASGSGKSTLLHLLGGLELPSSGSVWVDGQEMSGVSDTQRGVLRNQYLGFVYQFHHLLPEFSAIENVAMPLFIKGVAADTAKQKAQHLLEQIGLGHRLEHRPTELSGGERQRAAIARAMVTEPAVVLADEPTGNLDSSTAQAVFDLLLDLNARVGTSLVMVTHDKGLASQMDRVLHLEDGQLSS
ncbi:MAG: lipoprotein-releasing ABC transporter ATP-binding protein LolD [Pseudomonadota bacterium]